MHTPVSDGTRIKTVCTALGMALALYTMLGVGVVAANAQTSADSIPVEHALAIKQLTVKMAPTARAYAYVADTTVWVVRVQPHDSVPINVHGQPAELAWSPDGHRLAFAVRSRDTATVIVWNAAARTERMYGTITGHLLGWTPTGAALLVQEDIGTPTAPPRDPRTVNLYGPSELVRKQSTGVLAPPARPAQRRTRLTLIALASGARDIVIPMLPETGPLYNGSTVLLSPDDRYIALQSSVPDPVKPISRCTVVIHDRRTGASRTVADAIPCAMGLQTGWSPDSRWLAMYSAGDFGFGVSLGRGDVLLVGADSGVMRSITPGEHQPYQTQSSRLIWSRDARSLIVTAENAIWQVAVPSGTTRLVARMPGKAFRTILPSPDGVTYWSSDGGRSLVAAANDSATLATVFLQVDVATGRVTTLLEAMHGYDPESYVGGMLGSTDGQRFLYWREDLTHPPDLYADTADFSQPRQLTHLNPQIDSTQAARAIVLTWRSPKGDVIRGPLLLPDSYVPGHRYPLVVETYPTMAGYASLGIAASINRFGMRCFISCRLLATRGYAVLIAAPPRGYVTQLADVADGVLPGVEAALKAGIVDSARVGVMGLSMGGGNVVTLLTQTHRFAAAVAIAPVTVDMISRSYSFVPGSREVAGVDPTAYPSDTWALGPSWSEWGSGGLKTSLWENRDGYINNSPLFFLDRVTTPLLLLQGTADSFVVGQADEVYVALRRLGKPVVYARYRGEGHDIGNTYMSPTPTPNGLDVTRRALGWFADYLSRAPQSSSTSTH